MKRFYRLAWLTLLMGLFIACGSPPPNDPVAEEVEEVAEPVVIEVEPATEEPPTAEPTEETEETEAEMEEEEMAEEEPAAEAEAEAEPVTVTDGPTHTPATTIEEALAERPYDQAKGADAPLMTIIEYGDFQ